MNKTEQKTVKTVKRKTAPKTKAVDTIYQALNKFQKDVPILIKNTKGYGYNYVDLSEIIRIITPILNKYNLGVIQPLTTTGIKTILYHTVSGDTIESYVEIPQDVELKGMNTYQAYGSAITYFRRYTLSSLLGLVSDKDSDASGQQKPAKKNIVVRAKLSNASFQRAVDSIAKGEYSKQELLKNFDLTNEQTKIAQAI